MMTDWLLPSRRVKILEAEVDRLSAQLAEAERGLATEAVVAFGERLGTIYMAVTESLAATAANMQALSEVNTQIDALVRRHDKADEDQETLKKSLADWHGELRSVERQLRLSERNQADAMRVVLNRLAQLRATDAA